MPDNLKRFDFFLHDTVGGRPISPANVDLPTLRGFLEEVEKLIKGDSPGESLSDSQVRIEDGSLKVGALVSLIMAASVDADLRALAATGDLDVIQPPRAAVIELWQKRAQRSTSRRYAIGSEASPAPLEISASGQLQHRSENAWVAVERYLVGRVVNMGGKQNPNVHIVLTDSNESLRVNASEQQLGAEKENQLYKERTLRVQAEQHLKTKGLRNVRLVEFLPTTIEADEGALQALWKRGKEAWGTTGPASAWVEALRGNT